MVFSVGIQYCKFDQRYLVWLFQAWQNIESGEEDFCVPFTMSNILLALFYMSKASLSCFSRFCPASCLVIYSKFCLGNVDSRCYQYLSTGNESLRKSNTPDTLQSNSPNNFYFSLFSRTFCWYYYRLRNPLWEKKKDKEMVFS